MKTSITRTSKYVIVALLWLAIWEGVALLVGEELLFPTPASTLMAFLRLAKTSLFWQSIGFSIIRVLGGFVLGFVLASLFAVLAFKFSFFKLFISPFINIVKATPVASFIILALIFVGKNFVPVLICVLMVMPIVYSNVLSGLNSVDVGLLEMAKVYKMKASKVYVPSLSPFLSAAVGSGLGLCWKAGIASEVICRTLPSIGNSIWETKFYLLTDEMFAWTMTVILLSVIFDSLLRRIRK